MLRSPRPVPTSRFCQGSAMLEAWWRPGNFTGHWTGLRRTIVPIGIVITIILEEEEEEEEDEKVL